MSQKGYKLDRTKAQMPPFYLQDFRAKCATALRQKGWTGMLMRAPLDQSIRGATLAGRFESPVRIGKTGTVGAGGDENLGQNNQAWVIAGMVRDGMLYTGLAEFGAPNLVIGNIYGGATAAPPLNSVFLTLEERLDAGNIPSHYAQDNLVKELK